MQAVDHSQDYTSTEKISSTVAAQQQHNNKSNGTYINRSSIGY